MTYILYEFITYNDRSNKEIVFKNLHVAIINHDILVQTYILFHEVQ